MTKRCPNCYNPNNVKNAFCASCGYKFTDVGATDPYNVNGRRSDLTKNLWIILIVEIAIGAMIATALLIGALNHSPSSPAVEALATPSLAAPTSATPSPAASREVLPVPDFSNGPTPTDVPGFISLPTVTPFPTSTPVPVVTILPPSPVADNNSEPTLTPTPIAPPTPQPPIPTATRPASTAAQTTKSATTNFNPYQLEGSYKRDDGMLYGRPEVALYGAGSGYDQGTTSFKVEAVPNRQLFLKIVGLDDERGVPGQLQVLINGAVVFDGPTSFPHVPNGDIGVGGADRYWGQMSIPIPAGTLKVGTNTLTIRNATPWNGSLGVPYILINSLDFSSEE